MFVKTAWSGSCIVLLLARAWAGDAPVDRSAEEFFETRVRPVLAENCFGCHGADKQQAGLRLDSREMLLKGSDTGPVVIMGEPEKSTMILAIRHAGELKMPPRKQLSGEAVEAIAAWIKLGAPWPSDGGTAASQRLPPPGATHWAFQPLRDPQVPPAVDTSWATSPVDHFIAARLAAAGLAPQPLADRRTLLRRASFDLVGLPPTFEEVAAFEADASPDAWARVVDRLLDSPRHGERWGRHWLDVARYADTKGYVFEEERRYPYSYTYRDYVVRAFNEDLPYDRFIEEQIAADLLDLGDDKRPLAAMGFLTLGRRFLNNKADIIDDRLDVICRGVMGLTVTCARCHDHKYDPIPTADYYSLYGVLASADEPRDPPLLGMAEEGEAYRAYTREVEEREAEVTRLVAEEHAKTITEARGRTAEYLLAAAKLVREGRRRDGDEKQGSPAAGELNRTITGRWRDFLARTAEAHHPVFAPWNAFAALKEDELAMKSRDLAQSFATGADAAKPIHPRVAGTFTGEPPQTLQAVAERYGTLIIAADQPVEKREPALEEIRQAVYGDGGPLNIPVAEADRLFNRAQRDRVRNLRKKIDAFKATSPAAPPRAMSLAEASKPHDPVIFIRGNASNAGRPVPRQFLEVLSRDRKPFTQGSGRLELAREITSPNNPLTARVIVNRVWMHHFGAGLVRTPGDFGLRSEPPTHPELLDWLASRLIESGWSLKKLHRLMLLSSTYTQAADAAAADPAIDISEHDPGNRLLGRQNRRRLDFESLRDSLLFAAGRLDSKQAGAAVDILKQPFSTRRSIYAFIDRQNLPGLFRNFDFASPDVSTPVRHETTVPQQALFLMNSPFVVEQAQRLAARESVTLRRDPMGKVEALYRLVLAREPDADELEVAVKFLDNANSSGSARLSRTEALAQMLLLSNEFAFAD